MIYSGNAPERAERRLDDNFQEFFVNDECYVYIVLPGETEFMTAGKFVLSTDRHGVATGKFAGSVGFSTSPVALLLLLLRHSARSRGIQEPRTQSVLQAFLDAATARSMTEGCAQHDVNDECYVSDQDGDFPHAT